MRKRVISIKKQLTLGSLFDGIGGFPLAGLKAGIEPIWASEIEPFPIRVTTKRFPNMRHLGNICEIHGGAITPVDIITFGSPCQNLSIAGNREGLEGSQSSLFFQAIRIIHEMREATNGRYPRWAVWENVPGALSSAKGTDFREILQSLIRIKKPEANVPMPDGKWLPAGEILDDDCSIAWRVIDAAKGWGVAQRRRRVFVVIDLDGQCASKVLFESEGLSGYSPPSSQTGQETAACVEIGIGETSEHRRMVFGISADQSNSMLSGNPYSGIYEAETSRTLDCSGGNPSANQGGIAVVEPDTSDHKAYVLQGSMIGRTDENGPKGDGISEEVCYTLNTIDRPAVVCLKELPTYCMTVGSHGSVEEEGAQTLVARNFKDPPLVGKPWAAQQNGEYEYLVRRLTPDECCRLQGYPDGWCKNLDTINPQAEEIQWWKVVHEAWNRTRGLKKCERTHKQIIKWLRDPHSDTAEYKAYGNSVAVPCVFFVLAGIVWANDLDEKKKLEDCT